MAARDTNDASSLIDRMVDKQAAIAAAQAELAALEVEFVDLRRREDDCAVGLDAMPRVSARYAADEIGLALRRPTMTVQRQVARTRRIRSQLPQVWAMWRSGRVDEYAVSVIDQAALRLVHPESWVRLDDALATTAAAKTTAQLRSWLHRFVARTEPDEHHRRHRHTLAGRDISIEHGPDGTGWVTGEASSADVAAVDHLITNLARGLGADDQRTMGQRRSDIFFDLLLGRRPQDTAADGAGRPRVATTIGITVPIQSLVGDSDVSGQLLDRTTTVPVDVVRDRAIEPGTLFYRLLTDPVGNLLDVTQMGRFPTTKLGFAIHARDATCTMPTCNHPATSCDLDHTRPHPRGPTAADNLGPLDRRHHNAKTDDYLQVRQPRPGHFTWTTPTGHAYTTKPEPLPTAGWLTYEEHAALHPGDYLTAEAFDLDDPTLDDPALDELLSRQGA